MGKSKDIIFAVNSFVLKTGSSLLLLLLKRTFKDRLNLVFCARNNSLLLKKKMQL